MLLPRPAGLLLVLVGVLGGGTVHTLLVLLVPPHLVLALPYSHDAGA